MKSSTTGETESKVIHNPSSLPPYEPLVTLQARLIEHILWLKSIDIEYARSALLWYDQKCPWMDLRGEVRKRLGK